MSRDNVSEHDEIIWGAAIHEWLEEGNNLPLLSLIEHASSLPEEARDIFADLIKGSVKRRRGGRDHRSGEYQRKILGDVFRMRDEGNTREKSIEAVAAQRGLNTDSVRGLVNRAHKRGFTFQRWQNQWGKPKF